MYEGPKLCARRGMCVLLAALAAGCSSQPLAEGVRPDGRKIVLLLDSSSSMQDNDPARHAHTGAELVMGLAGSEDNVGVIAYGASAEVVRPLGAAGGTASRRRLRQALAEVSRSGLTHFPRALSRAREMLEAGGAGKGSTVLLLTDGVPTDTIPTRGLRRLGGPSLDEALEALVADGYQVNAIALGAQASDRLLERLVVKTRGFVRTARDATELVEAFEEVGVQTLGYMRARRGARELSVGEGTRRLAFLSSGGARLGELRREGQPVPDAQLIRSSGPQHDVALAEEPAPGAWSVDAEGEVVALLEADFGLEILADRPPERVVSGERVEVAVRLIGDPETVAHVAKRVSIRAELELPSGERVARTVLEAAPDDPALFAGSFRAPVVAEDSAVQLVVTAHLVEGGGRLVLEQRRSLTVAPGSGVFAKAKPLDLEVSPAQVTLRVWDDASPGGFSLRVRGDPERAVTLRCGERSLELPAGGARSLALDVSSGTVQLSAASADGAEWAAAVPVTTSRYALAGDPHIELPDVPAGVPVGPLPLGELRLARGAGSLSFGRGSLRGPGGARIELRADAEGLWVEPGSALPPGKYTGSLPVGVAGAAGLGTRAVPVTGTILPPLPTPEAVVLRGSFGWVSSPVEVAWPSQDEVEVTIRPRGLVGEGEAASARIHPELDVRVEPLDDWEGTRLGFRARRFALSVYLSSDLPGGHYTGSVTLEASGGGDPLDIPVQLEVRR